MDDAINPTPFPGAPIPTPAANPDVMTVSPQTTPPASGFFTTPMPSINELFVESWAVFKRSFMNLLVLNGLSWILFMGLGGVLLLLLAVFGGLSALPAIMGSTQGGANVNPALLLPFIGVLVLIGIVGFVGAIIIASVLQTGTILVVANSEAKVSFGEIIKKSIGLIIPLMVVSFVTGFMSFGATFVFFFPAIIFAFFFMFTSYEVVLGGKRGLDALRSSVYVMQKRGGDVFVRIIAFIGLYLCLWLANMFITAIGSVIKILETPFGLFYYVASAILGWFAAAYMVTLYRQAKAGLPEGKGHLRWFGVVAIIGWVFFFFFMLLVMMIVVATAGKQYDNVKSGGGNKYLQVTPTPDWNKNIVPTIKWNTGTTPGSY